MSRMLARIRRRQQLDEQFRAAIEVAVASPTGAAGPRSAPADPARLRAIPMIGGAAGAIPGTVPHRNRRLDRWRGRG